MSDDLAQKHAIDVQLLAISCASGSRTFVVPAMVFSIVCGAGSGLMFLQGAL